MPADQDLFTALQMYAKGVNELSLSRTLSSANDAVAQIKAAEGSEQDKRAQLQDLSNNLVRSLGSLGVAPEKISQQAENVFKNFKNPAEAAMTGTLTGKPSLVEAAKTADVASQAGDIAKLNVVQAGQERLQNIKFGQAVALGKGSKPLNANEIEKIQKYDEIQISGQNLLSLVGASPGLVGPIKGRIPGRDLVNPDFAAFQSQVGQFFDKYRIAVTGAGASPGELKALQKNVPVGTDTAANFKKKMNAMLTIGNRVRQRYLENLSKAGRSVGGFTTPSQTPGDNAQAQADNGDDISKFIMEQ